MSTPSSDSERQAVQDGELFSADDALPPVEPPSASFILQLFVVPGVIVGCIVVLAMLITWLVRSGDDPHRYLKALRNPGPGRWQAANNLANGLRDGRHEAFKQDSSAARKMGAILVEEIERGSMGSRDIELRQFLAKALGEMHTAQGLPALLRAASTDRDPAEEIVRRWSVEAIATLAENLAKLEPPRSIKGPELEQQLLDLSRDESDDVRIAATMALASVGGGRLLERLQAMLADPVPAVRHNAAVRLALHGNTAAIPVLQEILDPISYAQVMEQQARNRPQGVGLEQWEYRLEKIRELSVVNALRATETLAKAATAEQVAPLVGSIEQLIEVENNLRLADAAKKSLERIREPQAAAVAAEPQ